jgi:hypothetical protein
MAPFMLDSGWANEVRKVGEEAVDRCATMMVLTLRFSGLAASAGTGNEMTPSSRRFRPSTRRPKCERKSTTMRA